MFRLFVLPTFHVATSVLFLGFLSHFLDYDYIIHFGFSEVKCFFGIYEIFFVIFISLFPNLCYYYNKERITV